jgi:hypothetical protein
MGSGPREEPARGGAGLIVRTVKPTGVMEHPLPNWTLATLLVVLTAIAVEDLRARSIHWWWLPAMALSLWMTGWPMTHTLKHLEDAGWNIGFLVLQASGVGAWWLLRKRPAAGLLHQLGSGDILFLIALAVALPRWEFLPVLLTGLGASLLGAGLLRWWRPNSDPTVPLAGLMAIHLGLWTLTKHLLPGSFWTELTPTLLAHG